MPTTRLTSIRNAEYLGSHSNAPSSLPDVDLVFSTAGVRFERNANELGAIGWADVTDLSVDGTHVTRRPTFVPFLLVGIWAWLFQRRTDTVLVRIATDEGNWVFGVDDLTVDELRAGLAQLRPYHRS